MQHKTLHRRKGKCFLLILLLIAVGITKMYAQTEGLLNGVFSINEQVQVGFSKGNLQYQASTNTWRFAEEQTDYIGAANSNISSINDGWIDLFGWGTSGINHGAVCYQPWSTSQNNASYYAYGNGANNLFSQTGQADWGYNAISNGGNQTGQWRTLTMENWYYLLYTRSTPSGMRYTYANIDGIKGLILFPDNWSNTIYTFSTSYWDYDNWFEANTITISNWKDVIEPAGAVFLPASSYRAGTTYYDYEYGNYWTSSTSSNGSEYAASMGFESWFDPFMFYGWDYYGSNKSNGLSVRLAKTIQATSYTITTEVDPVDGGSVTGGGDYEYGQYCTLTAIPNEGYSFCSWLEDGTMVSLEPTYGFTVTENRNLVADFNECGQKCNLIFNLNDSYGDGWNEASLIINFNGIPYRTLTLDYSNGYSGTFSVPVMSDAHLSLEWVPGGYDYECSFTVTYESGIQIFQISSPSSGLLYEFDCNCGDLFTITTISYPHGGGTLTGAGYYGSGEICTLTATANNVHVFENWTKDGIVVSNDSTYSFTVTEDATYVANFTWTNPASIDYVTDGLIMYLDGIYNTRGGHSTTTNVWEDLTGNYDLTVNNYSSCTWEENHFFGLGNGGYLNTGKTWKYFNSLNNDITIEIVTYIDCDKTSPSWRGLAGWHSGSDGTNFQNDQGSGRMQTLGQLPVTEADDRVSTVSYTRNEGSFLNGVWKTNSSNIPSGVNSNQTVVFGNSYSQSRGWNDSIYCIRMYNRSLTPEEIAYNHSIDIERFGAGLNNTSIIGAYANPAEGGTVTGGGQYHNGVTCALVATANEGYTFENWTKEDTIVSENTTYSFTVTEDAIYVANFSELIVLDTTIYAEICFGDSYMQNGFEIIQPQVGDSQYSITLPSSQEYDSIVNLTLTVYPVYFFAEDTTLCNTTSFEWRGSIYTESGIYYDSLQTIHGCDSIFALSLELFNTPVGDFTYMSPTDNYPFTSLPITFAWDAVQGAEYYDLYVWDADESMPDEPFVTNLRYGNYSTSALQNYHTYNWYVKARNACNESSSTVKSFYLDITPSLNVNVNHIDFGEVAMSQSTSTTLSVTGIVLEDALEVQVTGDDAAMFSYTQASGWNNYNGGILIVTFSPTTPQYSYSANLVVSSGTFTETITLIGAVSNLYTFNTYVAEDVYAMNSQIPIYGSVTDWNNAPVANAEVEIGVFVMGMKRTLQAMTNASGQFSAVFEPMPTESGYYTVNSGRVGNHSTVVHDDFNIPGMALVSSDYILCAVTQDLPKTDSILIRNKSNLPLNNIQLTVLSAPDGCSFSSAPISMGGLEEDHLVYTVTGSTLTQGNYYEEVRLKATSSEGAETNITVWYYCMEPRGVLDVAPKSLITTMTKGKSKIVDVMLTNNGTGETGNIIVDLPNVEWMSVVGNDTLPSLAVNDTAYFSLRFSPDNEIPLVQYSGTIAINSERGDAIGLPYTITAVADSTGTLVIDVTDDYTWNTNNGNGPHLEGAEVTLKGYYSLETVAYGFTDANGIFQVDNVPEGYYRLQVIADRHSYYNNVVFITAGETNNQDIYLQYQAVTYSWIVEPTEIQDEYTYELDVVFETNVPAPVVTIDISSQVPELEYGESYTFNAIVTNHGLIAARDFQLIVPELREYNFNALYDFIDSLPALTTIVIPITVNRVQPDRYVSSTRDNNDHCWARLGAMMYYVCGRDRKWHYVSSRDVFINTCVLIALADRLPNLPCWWCGPGGSGNGGGGGSGSNDTIQPEYYQDVRCHPCDPILKEFALCLPILSDLNYLGSSIPGRSNSAYGNAVYWGGKIPGGVGSAIQGAECAGIAAAYIQCQLEYTFGSRNQALSFDDFDYLFRLNGNLIEIYREFYQDSLLYEKEGFELLHNLLMPYYSNSVEISESEANTIKSNFENLDIPIDSIDSIINRWNQTIIAWNNAVFEPDINHPNIINKVHLESIGNDIYEILDYSSSMGFDSFYDLVVALYDILDYELNNTSNSVCSTVTVRFSQNMTMTREAFEGTFTVHNGHDSEPMEAIGLDFIIKDEDGNVCNNLFQINTMSLNNLTEIDGTGALGAGLNGVAKIQFIPTKYAAPTEPKVYYFGGTFSFIDPYTLDELVYELYPVEIIVNPSPDLYVDYFMQRTILGDDALTEDVVEPSVPAELGVIIHNQGVGTAKNVMLETAEPQIIDNEKGLAIDFAMYGASFNGSPRQLGLMEIPFGNIESGQTAVGEWLFTSSLLGHFISYEAHVIHNSSYGNPDLSLVSHLDIHELIHPIYAYGSLDDGINDFLVNDIPDAYDTPDSIYFSHGGKTSVSVMDEIEFDHLVSPSDTIVTLTVVPSRVGWNYGVTDDPGMNQYDIVSCIRTNDNQQIPLNNVWLTFVTIPDGGDPVYENKLHIVDTLSVQQSTTYTLVFRRKPSNLRIFNGNVDEYWSNAFNWEGNVMPQDDDEVLINGICLLDEDVEVFSLTVAENQSLTIPVGRILTTSGTLTSEATSRLVIQDGGQLVHKNVGVQATVQKDIEPYTNNYDGYYLIATPLAGFTAPASVVNMLSNDYDLYYFDQSQELEWINYEGANGNYELVPGKGYLYANSEGVVLEFAGELRSGATTLTVPLIYTEGAGFMGFNLVGNPFVYNLTTYASHNVAEGCYRMNEAKDDLMVSEISESNPLKPAEGFFVKATDEGAYITFNPQMTSMAPRGSINVELSDNGLLIDRLIVKTDEGRSLEKFNLKATRSKLFAQDKRHEYAIVPCESHEQPVSFKAAKNGTYTVNVNADGMEFYYLHLIDNLTGNDVNLLSEPSYTFEARTTDYASRFLLRFIPKDGPSTGSGTENFAFNFNGTWIIANEGDATLQVVDMMGHVLSSERINGTCEKQMDAAAGVYLLRLINGNNVKVQKIIVK